MKRKIKRVYRRLMRQVARFILGFDNCPSEYKKNYVYRLMRAIMVIVSGFFMVLAFTVYFVICS